MAKPRKLGDLMYNYVLDHFKTIHEQANTSTIVNFELPCYKNISEIIRGILKDPIFFDVDEYRNDKTPSRDQIEVSKGTIRGAINRLIADKKIATVDGYWEYVPSDKPRINEHPIFKIAPQTTITVNVPESYLVLSVSNGLAASVAEYLSAQFYKRDIIFIPIGDHIICIGTLPESVVKKQTSTDNNKEHSPQDNLYYRITSVLHPFELKYPEFSYGINYEAAYTSTHDPEFMQQIHEMAFDDEKKKFSYHRYMLLMRMFKSLPWLEEYQSLAKIFGTSNPDHDGVNDEEWDLTDSPIMGIVDEEFEE